MVFNIQFSNRNLQEFNNQSAFLNISFCLCLQHQWSHWRELKAVCNLYVEYHMNKIDIISSLHEYFAWVGFGETWVSLWVLRKVRKG